MSSQRTQPAATLLQTKETQRRSSMVCYWQNIVGGLHQVKNFVSKLTKTL